MGVDSPHSFSNRACKSKVLKIYDVILSDDNDNFDNEGEGKETTRSHQKVKF